MCIHLRGARFCEWWSSGGQGPHLEGRAGGSCVILADFPLPTLAETESGATSS